MTSRERVFAALNHQQPDRVPVDAMLEATTLKTLMFPSLSVLSPV